MLHTLTVKMHDTWKILSELDGETMAPQVSDDTSPGSSDVAGLLRKSVTCENGSAML
jgi:hypothetical protein